MKTTVEIADALFEQARQVADREGTTLRALIEDGPRKALADRASEKPFRLRDASFKGPGRGLTPEFATGGWAKIRAAIYEDPE